MVNQKLHVYGIGNAISDLMLNVSDQDLAELGMEKGAMQLVDKDEQARFIDYFQGRALHQASGGSAANTMISLTQLGGFAAYACVLGDDDFGTCYAKEMRDLGVQLHTMPLHNQPSGTCLVLITPDAERTMNTHLGASASLGPEHIDESLLKQAQWLYVEGYLFSSESGQEAVRRAISLAKQHQVKVAITFSDGFIVDVFGDFLKEVVQKADLVFANLNEAQLFTAAEDEQEILARLCTMVPNAAVTLGVHGALVHFDGTTTHVQAVQTEAIDATGAGDMFAGGFLYGITHGLQGEESGRLACFLASKVVSQLGPRLSGDIQQMAGTQGLLP